MSEKKLILSKKAQEMIESDTLIMDIEMTGLDYPDVVSFCLISAKTEEILIDTLVKPKLKITPGAGEIHGLNEDDLINAPSFTEVWKTVEHLRKGRRLTSYMTSSDFAAIEFSLGLDDQLQDSNFSDISVEESDAHNYYVGNVDKQQIPNFHVDLKESVQQHCIQKMVTTMYGATNTYRALSLKKALSKMNITFEGRPHTAKSDAVAALRVLQHIANFERRMRIKALPC